MTVTNDIAIAPADSPISGVTWPAIVAGALAAGGVSMILLSLGSGLGLATAAPGHAPGPVTFGVMTAVWLLVTQWVASGIGGYLTGRLRTRWANTHTHEVFFRDTAHGFLTWALASVAAVVLITPALSSAAHMAAASAAPAPPADPEALRKATAAFSIYTALSMLIGAFIASVAAAIGGHERDMHP